MNREAVKPCRVKICGITSLEDARYAAELGADALGLVFYDKSPRNLNIKQALEIYQVIPPFVTVVGLFLDARQAFVEDVLADVPLDLLQFHGSESPEFCSGFARPYIKAVGMQGIITSGGFAAYADQHTEARGLLLDSHVPGAAGGTGKVFDWSLTPQDYHKPVILAGGLHAGNIAEALRTPGVYAVDVSTGVESAPGVKDHAKMAAFMRAVRMAEYGLEL
ncbi:MAG: phosphoribosylanthranilate isomerase [Thiolinea sp.]